MTNYNSICVLCTQKKANYRLNRLQHILQYVTQGGKVCNKNVRSLNMQWEIHSHCRYGISCPELNRQDTECRRVAERIEPYIAEIIESQDTARFRGLLELLRGDFPQVYRSVERNFYMANRKRIAS